MPGRARTALALVLVNAVLILVVLAAAELYVRRSAVPSTVKYSVYTPNISVTVKVDPNVTPGVAGGAVFEINAVGTRGPLPSPADDFRIVAIGGSTTECFVLSLEESWPWLLGEKLKASTGKRVWVGNIGRAGRTSRQHYFDAKYVVPQLGRVDVAILLVGVNDLFNRMIQGTAFDAQDVVKLDAGGSYIESSLQIGETPAEGLSGLELAKRLRRGLEGLKLLSPRVREIQRSLNHALPDYYVQSREERADRGVTLDALPPMEAALAEFDRNLRSIVRLLRSNGTTPILVTQPALWKTPMPAEEERLLWLGSADGWPPSRLGGPYYSVRAMIEMLGMYNEALGRIAADEGVEMIDLARLVPSDLGTFYDDVHFNESGARRVAEAMAARIPVR